MRRRRPYDDTGWTFPEGFGVQAVRITDAKVLDVPMELVKGDVKAPSGVSGQGTVFAINHNADNALITLRYRLKDADIQMAEEPFESGGTKFNRGTFIIKGVAQADLDKAATELGLKAVALAAAPSVKTHPARAARVAILHQWSSTQTEGWWRQAFDLYGVPYDYIDPETIRKTANLRDKYDVIIFGPGGGQAAVEGTPMWKNPIPWKNSPEMPNVGTWAQTDDTRIGMGLEGLIAPARLHRQGRRLHRLEQQRGFRHHQQLRLRRRLAAAPARPRASSARCCARSSSTRRARSCTACRTTWRCTATAATASPSARRPVAAGAAAAAARRRRRRGGRRARRWRRRRGRPAAARRTIRTWCRAGRRTRGPT